MSFSPPATSVTLLSLSLCFCFYLLYVSGYARHMFLLAWLVLNRCSHSAAAPGWIPDLWWGVIRRLISYWTHSGVISYWDSSLHGRLLSQTTQSVTEASKAWPHRCTPVSGVGCHILVVCRVRGSDELYLGRTLIFLESMNTDSGLSAATKGEMQRSMPVSPCFLLKRTSGVSIHHTSLPATHTEHGTLCLKAQRACRVELPLASSKVLRSLLLN